VVAELIEFVIKSFFALDSCRMLVELGEESVIMFTGHEIKITRAVLDSRWRIARWSPVACNLHISQYTYEYNK